MNPWYVKWGLHPGLECDYVMKGSAACAIECFCLPGGWYRKLSNWRDNKNSSSRNCWSYSR